MTNCSEGMEVRTEGEDIDQGRQAVLEYMLINHPLDCPVCDKAGECDLQDYTFNYRGGHSRFDENKVIRHTKDLGPNIKIWGNRCISCTRCVRFCDEITGTGELSLVNRGDHSVVDVHPEFPIDNPMSLNVVDICPVGALIDKNFLYQARVWFSRRIDTVCTSCSRGCNVTATVKDNEIKRLQPRHNEDVNSFWMCDAGRLNIGHVSDENRLFRRKGRVQDLVDGVQGAAAGSLAILASTYQTVEELFLIQKLAKVLGASVGFYTMDKGERWVAPSGFAIETDKTPNRKGVERFFDRVEGIDGIVAGIESGAITGLISLNGIPDYEYPPALLEAAKRLQFLAVMGFQENPLVDAAQIVVPVASWAEKHGTFINQDGRVQRIQPLVQAPISVESDLVWLQTLLTALGEHKSTVSAEGIFRQAMPDVTYADVGAGGLAT